MIDHIVNLTYYDTEDLRGVVETIGKLIQSKVPGTFRIKRFEIFYYSGQERWDFETTRPSEYTGDKEMVIHSMTLRLQRKSALFDNVYTQLVGLSADEAVIPDEVMNPVVAAMLRPMAEGASYCCIYEGKNTYDRVRSDGKEYYAKAAQVIGEVKASLPDFKVKIGDKAPGSAKTLKKAKALLSKVLERRSKISELRFLLSSRTELLQHLTNEAVAVRSEVEKTQRTKKELEQLLFQEREEHQAVLALLPEELRGAYEEGK